MKLPAVPFKEYYLIEASATFLYIGCGYALAGGFFLVALSSFLMGVIVTILAANEMYIAGRWAAVADARRKSEETKRRLNNGV